MLTISVELFAISVIDSLKLAFCTVSKLFSLAPYHPPILRLIMNFLSLCFSFLASVLFTAKSFLSVARHNYFFP